MAQNRVQNGHSVDVVLAADQAPGAPFVFGDIIGITEAGGKTGELVSVTFNGVWKLTKAAGAGTGVAAGKRVYYDTVTKKFTGTTGANTILAGQCWKTALDADTEIQVRLCQ